MTKSKKDGERSACGKLKRERFPPTLIRQMVDAGRAQIIHASFGTQIGRMRLEQVLVDHQVSAARHFASFMGRYDILMGNGPRTAKSPDYISGRSEPTARIEAVECEGRKDEKCGCAYCSAVRRAREEYDRVEAALSDAEWSIVYSTVLMDEVCAWPDRPSLVSGLNTLAELYGYIPRRKT